MGRARQFSEGEIVEQAMLLFWQYGYHGVSTSRLTDALGLSKSSLYNTFSDKRSLFILGLNHYNDTATRSLTRRLSGSSAFKTKIKSLLRYIMDSTCDDAGNKSCFLVNTAIDLAPHDAGIMEILEQSRQSLLDALAQAAAKAIDAGELSEAAKPKQIAGFLAGVISGLRVDCKISKDKTVHRATIQAALSVLDEAS